MGNRGHRICGKQCSHQTHSPQGRCPHATSLAKAIKKHRKALWEFLEGKSPIAQSCQWFPLWEIEDIAVVERGAVFW
jgi:hypothetical protein